MIRIDSIDLAARSVTFTANGRQKTIEGLGDFPSQRAFVEYLESVAQTDMAPVAGPLALDTRGLIGSPVVSENFPEADPLPPR